MTWWSTNVWCIWYIRWKWRNLLLKSMYLELGAWYLNILPEHSSVTCQVSPYMEYKNFLCLLCSIFFNIYVILYSFKRKWPDFTHLIYFIWNFEVIFIDFPPKFHKNEHILVDFGDLLQFCLVFFLVTMVTDCLLNSYCPKIVILFKNCPNI